MPPLGINCLDSFLNFRNRKKPKSSKQKIPAFFIWTKLSLFLLSISHSSRFPFLLTPIPPLLPILHFPLLHLIPFSPTPLFLYSNTPHFSFLFSNTSHFFPFSTFHFPLLHLIPFSPTPLFLYSNTPHFFLPFLQLPPLPLIFYFPFLQHLSLLLILHFPYSNASHFLPRPLFSIPIRPFLHISLFLYSNTPHSPSFPIPPHFSFSSKSNHVHSPKIPLLQNPKPENPFVLSQCSTPFAEPSSSFPYKKINAHPASPKTPSF